ncbi:MAG: ATP-binding cassette domain-containing protein [Pseudobdellovibrionaceae bacterium]
MKKIESFSLEKLNLQHQGHSAVFQQLDFVFPAGKILWLKSEEGAGKSSLLQVMAGLMEPQAGKYFINNIDVFSLSFEEFLPYRLRIGYSFDYGGLINNKNLFDNLLLPLEYHKICDHEQAKKQVQELIQIFDFQKYADERPAHVPGRVRKLTCLIRALVLKPDLLLLDDPSVGIGYESCQTLCKYILEQRQQGFFQHVIMSSYDEKFMNMFHPEVIYLSEGHLYFEPSIYKKLVNL